MTLSQRIALRFSSLLVLFIAVGGFTAYRMRVAASDAGRMTLDLESKFIPESEQGNAMKEAVATTSLNSGLPRLEQVG